jgi:hypothetical protein
VVARDAFNEPKCKILTGQIAETINFWSCRYNRKETDTVEMADVEADKMRQYASTCVKTLRDCAQRINGANSAKIIRNTIMGRTKQKVNRAGSTQYTN